MIEICRCYEIPTLADKLLRSELENKTTAIGQIAYKAGPAGRALDNADLLAFLAIITVLTYKSLTDTNVEYDNLSYHLPFAAIRTGIFKPEEYIPYQWLRDCFNGFPFLMDYIKGYLWKYSGNINATNLPSVFAVVGYCTFLRVAFGIRLTFSFLLIAAIPTIQNGLATGNLDLIANLSFSAALICAFHFYANRETAGKWFVFWALLFAGMAANTKGHFYVPSGLFAACFAAYCIGTWDKVGWKKAARFERAAFVCLTLAAFLSCIGLAARNLYFYGNPLFPIGITVGGIELPGARISDLYVDPAYLQGTPQPVRWLLSVIEYRALDSRPIPYMIGMGDVPAGSHSARMGGYFGFYFLFSLWLFYRLTLTSKNGRHKIVAVAFTATIVFVSFIPSSHELRYFSFVMVVLASVSAIHLKCTDFMNDIRPIYNAVVVSSFAFVLLVTGGVAFHSNNMRAQRIIDNFGIAKNYTSHFKDGATYCLVDWGQLPVLASVYFNRQLGIDYSIVQAEPNSDCPTNAEIVRYR